MRRLFSVVAAVVVLSTLTWLLYTPVIKYFQPKPRVVPACKVKASDFPTAADQVCSKMCGDPYDVGHPNSAVINGEHLFACCPAEYNKHIVTNTAGDHVDIICTIYP
jgi:hypothetical protein